AVAPGLLDLIGPSGAFLTVGLVLPIAVALSWPRLRRADDVTALPAHLLARLRAIPMFAALDVPSIDLLARRAIPLEVSDGTAVIREGEHGDRFFAIDDGTVEVTKEGVAVALLGPGDHFGEIALLRDVPRTATVTARGLVRLVAVERDDFLRVVTGFAVSEEEAHRIAQVRLDDLDARNEGPTAGPVA
ncbi:MAG TPA: cyclic nucleotide-binding domain-containing protein, partial [Actinomycetota bacterium]